MSRSVHEEVREQIKSAYHANSLDPRSPNTLLAVCVAHEELARAMVKNPSRDFQDLKNELHRLRTIYLESVKGNLNVWVKSS